MTEVITLDAGIEALLRDAIAQGERALEALCTPDSPRVDLRQAQRQLEAVEQEIEYTPRCRARLARKERSQDRHDLRQRHVTAVKQVERAEQDADWGPQSAWEMDDFSHKLFTLFGELERRKADSAEMAGKAHLPTLVAVAACDTHLCDTIGGAISRYYHPNPEGTDYLDDDDVRFRRLLDVLKEVLDLPQRAERIRLEQEARTLGLKSDGLTNAELDRRISQTTWADIRNWQ